MAVLRQSLFSVSYIQVEFGIGEISPWRAKPGEQPLELHRTFDEDLEPLRRMGTITPKPPAETQLTNKTPVFEMSADQFYSILGGVFDQRLRENAEHITSNRTTYNKIRYDNEIKSSSRRAPSESDPLLDDEVGGTHLLIADMMALDDRYVFTSYGPRMRTQDSYGFIFDAEALIRDAGASVGPDLIVDYSTLIDETIKDVMSRHGVDINTRNQSNAIHQALQRYYQSEEINYAPTIEKRFNIDTKTLNEALQDIRVEFYMKSQDLQADKRFTGDEAMQMLEDYDQAHQEKTLELLLEGEIPLKYVIGVIESGEIKMLTSESRGRMPEFWRFEADTKRIYGHADDVPDDYKMPRGSEHVTSDKWSFDQIKKDGKIEGRGHRGEVWLSAGGYYRYESENDLTWGIFDPDILREKYQMTPDIYNFIHAYRNNPKLGNVEDDLMKMINRETKANPGISYSQILHKYIEENNIDINEIMEYSKSSGQMIIIGDIDIEDAIGIIEDGEIRVITEETRSLPPDQWQYRDPAENELVDSMTYSAGYGVLEDYWIDKGNNPIGRITPSQISKWDADPNIFYRVSGSHEDPLNHYSYSSQEMYTAEQGSLSGVAYQDAVRREHPDSASKHLYWVEPYDDPDYPPIVLEESPYTTRDQIIQRDLQDRMESHGEGGYYDGVAATSTFEEALDTFDETGSIFGEGSDGEPMVYILRGEPRGRLVEGDGQLVKPTEIIGSYTLDEFKALNDQPMDFEMPIASEHMTSQRAYEKIKTDGVLKSSSGSMDQSVWFSKGAYLRTDQHRRNSWHAGWGFLFDPNVLFKKYHAIPDLESIYKAEGVVKSEVDAIKADLDSKRYKMSYDEHLMETNRAYGEYLQSKGLYINEVVTQPQYPSEIIAVGPIDVNDAIGVVEDYQAKIITEETRGLPPDQWKYRNPTEQELVESSYSPSDYDIDLENPMDFQQDLSQYSVADTLLAGIDTDGANPVAPSVTDAPQSAHSQARRVYRAKNRKKRNLEPLTPNQYKDLSWINVFARAAYNLDNNVQGIMKDTFDTLIDFDSTLSDVTKTDFEGAIKGKGLSQLAQNSGQINVNTELFNVVWDFYRDAYGLGDKGAAGLKRYIAEQPDEFMADMAMLGTFDANESERSSLIRNFRLTSAFRQYVPREDGIPLSKHERI